MKNERIVLVVVLLVWAMFGIAELEAQASETPRAYNQLISPSATKLQGTPYAAARPSFAFSVAMSGDGKTVAVGAPNDNQGSAFVFSIRRFHWILDARKRPTYVVGGDG